MRIGVLEWASCGGAEDALELSDSIRTEGWAMCRTALLSLIRGGHRAVAVVDPRCAIDPLISGYRCNELELVERSMREPGPNQWQRVYAGCDYTLVIAPECGRILERLLQWCRANNIRTCNCDSPFVRRSSDKLRTARFLQAAGVPHPPTRLLADAQSQWSEHAPESTLAIKPRDGAGCEGMSRVRAHELRSYREVPARGWIVQPWLSGEAYSRSAIVDQSGQIHSLPVTRQHLATDRRVTYLGGSVEPALAAQIPHLDELLTRAIRALGGRPRGWVGIDFLYDASNAQRPVTIIEINPRLTTSFVGLAAAGAPNLAAAIVAAAAGQPIELPSEWQSVRFTAAGSSDCLESAF